MAPHRETRGSYGDVEDPGYALSSSSEEEHSRLLRQGDWYAPYTRRLFTAAGVEPGMRVLDVGCGPGDVSFLAAELVGSRGSVVGKRQTGVGVTHSIHDHASVLASIPLRAILRGAMTDQPTTPDLVELGSRLLEAANRRDLDAALRFYAPDAVVENAQGLGTFEGKAAIRDFWQDWLASYGELWLEREEVLDLGHGLVFSVFLMRGRPVGSSRLVELRYAGVGTWRDGLIVRTMFSTDIDNARAAAERLAQE